MSFDKFNESKYKEDLKKYKKAILSNSEAANQIVNALLTLTFYEIGEDILSQGVWASEYISRISKDFPNHKTIMSRENIEKMCKFSSLISSEEIFTLHLFELTWTDLIPYINISKNHDEFVRFLNEERKTGKA